MKKQTQTSYRGVSFYKLMGAFFVVIFLFTALIVAVTLHFMNQDNLATEASYGEMADKVLHSAPGMVAGYYQIADMIAEIPEIDPLAQADSFPTDTREAQEFWTRFDSVYHSSMSGAGNVACVYFRRSGRTMGLGSPEGDPYASGEMTGDFGLSEEQWRYLTGTDTQTRAFCLKTEEMTFGRLMLSKEIYPEVVLLAGITDFNIRQTLQNFYLPPHAQAILLTGNDRSISSAENKTQLSDRVSFQQVAGAQGRQTVLLDGTPYFLYHTSLAEGSIEQAVFIPDTIRDGQMQVILNLILLALFCWLVIGGSFSYGFASRFYRPIGQLVSDLPMPDVDKSDPHEFQVVTTAVHRLYQQAQSYEQRLAQQNRLLADSLFLRLLQGEIPFSDEIANAFSNAGFRLESRFAVLMLQPELSDSEDPDTGKPVPALEELQERVCHFFSLHGWSPFFIEYRGLLLGAVSTASDGDAKNLLLQLQEELQTALGFPLTIVLSKTHTSSAEWNDAYREASETLEYNLLTGELGTVRQYQRSHRLSGGSSSSTFLNDVRKLENCLQAENDPEAVQCVQHIFRTLPADEPDAAVAMQKRIRYIFDTVHLYLSERKGVQPPEWRDAMKGQSLDDLCRELCAALSNAQKAEENDPLKKRKIHQITQYIQENYQNPNLSAGMIADSFNISLPWLSNLFKKELNLGFLDYLHRCRIEKAKELIRGTKYNIGDIAEMVGYTNAVTMTRAFKRYEGITPSWYRQNAGDAKE